MVNCMVIASLSRTHLALLHGRAIQAIKQLRAEDQILTPLGLNTKIFITQQPDMSESFVSRLTNQMQEYPGA